MRTRHRVVLFSLAIPCLLLQLDFSGCLNVGGGGTGGVGGGGGGAGGLNLPPTVNASADTTRGIAPLTVQFSSSGSTDDGVIVDRIWDFGDGQSSREIDPRHTYLTRGAFNATITLVDDDGARTTRTIVINVTDQPVAVLEVDRTVAESAPAVFQFNGSNSSDPDFVSTGAGDRCNPRGICRYVWNFDDGSSSDLPIVAHRFEQAGDYRVRLTVTDNQGITGFAERIIQVGIPQPTITFRAPPPSIPNLIVSNDSPLPVYGVFTVDPNVARSIRVGVDGDADPCESQAVVLQTNSGLQVSAVSGHGGPIRALEFSPDGRFLLTAADDRTVRMYSAGSPFDFVLVHNGVMTDIRALAISPDSQRFVVGTVTGQAIVRRLTSNSFIVDLGGHSASVNAIDYSPNGLLIASGDAGGRLNTWNSQTFQLIQTQADIHTNGINALAFSPVDSSRLVTGGADRLLKLWVAGTTTLVRSFAGHAGSVLCVAFSADGARLASGSADGAAIIWNPDTGALVRTLAGHAGGVLSIKFSPDGTQIVTGGADGFVRTWNATTGALLRERRPCLTPISSVAFSAAGDLVAAGIAASNDIQLDTTPSPSGNDLNFSIPQTLSLSGVPFTTPRKSYALWAEIDTDVTSPSRTYADTLVHVLPPFTNEINSFTPTAALNTLNDAAVILSGRSGGVSNKLRQIVDLGPLARGDRLFLSLVTSPGYAPVFTAPTFSLMLLDEDENIFAWYRDGRTLWSASTKLIIGHDSPRNFLVFEGFNPPGAAPETDPPNISVRVQRGAEPCVRKRVQTIFLNFEGGADIAIGSAPRESVQVFNAGTISPAWGTAETIAIRGRIEQIVRALLDPYQVEIVVSDGDPTTNDRPAGPHVIVFFGNDAPDSLVSTGQSLFSELGIFDAVDPRNDTLTGAILIYTDQFAEEFPTTIADPQGANLIGNAIGRATVHHLGRVLGLRSTTGATDIMRNTASALDAALNFSLAPADPNELYNGTIGFQDAPTILREIFGKVGACCLPGAACRDEVTEAECTALGGSFRGINSCCLQLPSACP